MSPAASADQSCRRPCEVRSAWPLLVEQPACAMAMEACATSHPWGRVVRGHDHEVRLMPAAYVTPFVKRQNNDRADAEPLRRRLRVRPCAVLR